MLQINYKKLNLLLFAAFIAVIISCTKSDSGFGFSSGDSKAPGGGKGGSMARFTVACDHLYVVDESSLHVLDVVDPGNPTFVKTINVGFGIETIFPYKDYLLLGSTTGMFVYSMDNCSNPVHVSTFQHIISCDPVVAEDDFAYITLRSGGDCRVGWVANELDVLDISDIKTPKFIKAHPVPEPYGLGIDNKTIFICHGSQGLGVYDISNPLNLIPMHMFPNIESYDVIPNNGVLIVTGAGGIFQFDYTNLANLVLLSTIPVP